MESPGFVDGTTPEVYYSLADMKDVLSADGVFYLVAVEPNNPQQILEIMAERGIQGDIVLKRKAGREVLYVLRFSRYTHKQLIT